MTRRNNVFLIPIGICLAVTAVTGAMVVGAHSIAATSLTTVADTQAISTAGALLKIAGPGLLLVGILGVVGTVMYAFLNMAQDPPSLLGDILIKGDVTIDASASIWQKSCGLMIASNTAIAAGIGCMIIGAVEPLSESVVQDFTITMGFFAALTVAMILFDKAWNNKYDTALAQNRGAEQSNDRSIE